MKILPFIILSMYALPPAGLLAYGISIGVIDSFRDFVSVLFRGLFVAIGAFAFGLGLSIKFQFLDGDGARFYMRFYLIYVAIFFLLNLGLGFEIVHSDSNEFLYRR